MTPAIKAFIAIVSIFMIGTVAAFAVLFNKIDTLSESILPTFIREEPVYFPENYPTRVPTMPLPSVFPSSQISTFPSTTPSNQNNNQGLYPFNLNDAKNWPVRQVCVGQYQVIYQFDDGTNIYKTTAGEYIRGQQVVCTN